MDTADVAGSRSEYENVDIKFCNVQVNERTQGKPVIIEGTYGEQLFIVETDKEGKKVFPTIVKIDDFGNVEIVYKQKGEIEIMKLSGAEAQELIGARTRKDRAVPTKNEKLKRQDNAR